MNRKILSKMAEKTELENVKEKVIELINKNKVAKHVSKKISDAISTRFQNMDLKGKISRRMSFTPMSNKNDQNDLAN